MVGGAETMANTLAATAFWTRAPRWHRSKGAFRGEWTTGGFKDSWHRAT